MLELEQPLVAFGHELRAEGVAVGSGQVVAWCEAVAALDPGDIDDLYWAGRTCLLSRRDDVPAYNRAFESFFGGGPLFQLNALIKPPDVQERYTLALGELRPGPPPEEPEEQTSLASSEEVLRNKPFAHCSEDELAMLRRLLAGIEVATPRRLSRRTEPHRRGTRPDLRRAIRRSLRADGDVLHPAWRRRRQRPRALVLLLDVSGSMAQYSRA